MSDIYCSLCGVQVEVHDGGPAADELLWNASVRAIRARAYVHDPYVTGLGYLNADRQICADADENVPYQDPAARLIVNDLFNGGFQPYFCFAVHDFCWRLLRHAVDLEKSFPTKTIARQLFAVLYNTPAEPSGALLPGHDYGGASAFRVHGGMQDPVAAIYGSDLFYILQDPDDEFDFDAEITTDLLPNNPYMGAQGVESRETDLFSRLPSEIIMLVVSKLPSKSVCNLRLASRHIAAYAAPSLLPQRFWASRFDAGAEMAFAFALREDRLPTSLIDWRQLYQRAQSMHKDFRTYPGFMNRWRIWKCIQQVTPALALRLQNMESVARSPYLGGHPRIPEGFSPLGNVSSHVTFEFGASQLNGPSTTDKLVAGSRLFEKQYLGIPDLAQSQPFRLGVSFISLVGTNYICGLRLLTTREYGQGPELSRAGFINPTTEQTVELGSLEDIDTISFQVSISGITGLSIQTRIMESPQSHVVGQFGDCAGVNNGVSQLKVGGKFERIGFLIGLDACKIVRLELFGKQSADESLCSTENEGPAEVWTPASPRVRVEWQHIYPSTQQTFNLCSAMDFGGSDGRLLGLLTQVNVFMGTFPQVFLGMSFVYADGSERAFGRKSYNTGNGRVYPCIVQSFPLSGPDGERICQADTSYMPSHDTIQRLSLSTTAGRSIAFGLHGEHLPQSEGICTNRRAPPGKVFTTFFSLHSSPVGHFRDFSALGIAADQPAKDSAMGDIAFSRNPWDAVITSMLYSAKELLAHSGGFAFTSASLCGLRRIRVSVGTPEYSRGLHNVSGLRLEYEGSASPVVVGQWISEHHEPIEISDGERLTKIVTFHQASNRFSRVKFGPMSGMSITTSKGRTMGVLPHRPAEGDVRLCFRETPYEMLDAVAWGCNYQWDHVRVMMKSRDQKDAAHRQLLFGPVNRQVPGWAVRDLVFLQEKTADGGDDPLESIQMTFKWMTSEPAALSFIYRSGLVLSLGVPGGKAVTETLYNNERLTRMDIGIFRNNRTPSIAFKTSQKRTLRFPYPGSSQTLKVQRWETHILQPDPDGNGEDGIELEGVHDIPGGTASRVVGFWAIPTRLDRTLQFPSFGPIFEQLLGRPEDS